MLDFEDLDFALLGRGIEDGVGGGEGAEERLGFLLFARDGPLVLGGVEGGLDGGVLGEGEGPAGEEGERAPGEEVRGYEERCAGEGEDGEERGAGLFFGEGEGGEDVGDGEVMEAGEVLHAVLQVAHVAEEVLA